MMVPIRNALLMDKKLINVLLKKRHGKTSFTYGRRQNVIIKIILRRWS